MSNAKTIIERMKYNTEGDVFTSLELAINKVTEVMDYVQANLQELEQLYPGLFPRPVAEMGLSEKVKVSKAIIALHKGIKESKV